MTSIVVATSALPEQMQGSLPLDFSRCQRWRDGRDRYRPAGEVFDHRHATVERIDTATAKAFVTRHHYAHSFPAARLNVGLFVKRPFQKETLSGVATFSVPMTQAVIPALLDGLPASQGVELGRFVLLDEIEANGESWTLARAFRILRQSLPEVCGVVSYCDPHPRLTSDGQIAFKGHIGTIYKAINATPRGRSKPRTLLLTPDGSVANERALAKLRNGESGADYVERRLPDQGATPRRMGESGADYLARIQEEGFLRRQRHPGNFAFSWTLK